MRIYDITEAHRSAMEAFVEDNETPFEAWVDTIEALEMTLEQKAEAYCAIVLELEAEAEAKIEAAKRITASAKTLETKAEWLRYQRMTAMQTVGKSEYKFSQFSAKLPKPRASVIIDDVDKLPPRYVIETTTRAADKKAVKEWIEFQGVAEVEGAHLEYKQSISIK